MSEDDVAQEIADRLSKTKVKAHLDWLNERCDEFERNVSELGEKRVQTLQYKYRSDDVERAVRTILNLPIEASCLVARSELYDSAYIPLLKLAKEKALEALEIIVDELRSQHDK